MALANSIDDGLRLGDDAAAIVYLREAHHGEKPRVADHLVDGDGSPAHVGEGLGGSFGTGSAFFLPRDLLRVLYRLAVPDVVELGHNVTGAANKVPDVKETPVGIRRDPGRVGLEGGDELGEFLSDGGS